jgi:hypothetical protein
MAIAKIIGVIAVKFHAARDKMRLIGGVFCT